MVVSGEKLTRTKAPGEVICDKCAYVAINPSHLEKHVKSLHERKTEFTCEECDFTTFWRDSLVRHVRRFHEKFDKNGGESASNMGSERFMCELCSFVTNWRGSYTRHMKNKHEKTEVVPTTAHRQALPVYPAPDQMRNKELQSPSGSVFTLPPPPTFDGFGGHLDLTPVQPRTNQRNGFTSPSDFACGQCDFVGISRSALDNHVKAVHENDKSFKCHKCDFVSAWKLSLSRHIKSTHGDKSEKYKCNSCSFETTWSNSFVRHMNTVHNIDAFRCPQCEFTCNNCELWTKHQLIHKSDSSESFKSYSTQALNELGQSYCNSNQPLYSCDQCDFQNSKKSVFLQHQKSVHNVSRNLPYQCEHCQFSTSWKDSLARHTKATHGEAPVFKCKMCDFSASSRISLNKHQRTHHPTSATYKCDLCNFSVSQLQMLEWHIRSVHDRIKEHTCEYCEFVTTRKKVLVSHVFQSHGKTAKLYQCDRCSFACARKGRLQDHNKSRHGDGNFMKCDQCDFVCKRRDSLRRHFLRRHETSNPFSCDMCSFRFQTEQSLQHHKKGVHEASNGSVLDMKSGNSEQVEVVPDHYAMDLDSQKETHGERVKKEPTDWYDLDQKAVVSSTKNLKSEPEEDNSNQSSSTGLDPEENLRALNTNGVQIQVEFSYDN